jgi:hypothetical protein
MIGSGLCAVKRLRGIFLLQQVIGSKAPQVLTAALTAAFP